MATSCCGDAFLQHRLGSRSGRWMELNLWIKQEDLKHLQKTGRVVWEISSLQSFTEEIEASLKFRGKVFGGEMKCKFVINKCTKVFVWLGHFFCWVDVVECPWQKSMSISLGCETFRPGQNLHMFHDVKNTRVDPVFAVNWSAISFLARLIHHLLHTRQHSHSWDVSSLMDRWTPALSQAQSAKWPSKCYGIDEMPLSSSWQAKTLILICVSPSHWGSRVIKTISTSLSWSVEVNSKQLINGNEGFYLPIRISNSFLQINTCTWN